VLRVFYFNPHSDILDGMNTRGFTMVELLVVISIMTLVVIMSFANINQTRGAARDKVRMSNIQDIRLSLEQYKVQCGEYPATLELDADNGNCPDGFTLGDVLDEIPTSPTYSDEPPFYQEVAYSSSYNGYYYAGLSTRNNGPCFEYHLAVPLEGPYHNSTSQYSTGGFLSEDYDCDEYEGTYDSMCLGSTPDFDDADLDENFGLFDFRSANNC
jgi:prepilin-type N-terminal cleavage/methylation domain-containing protein